MRKTFNLDMAQTIALTIAIFLLGAMIGVLLNEALVSKPAITKCNHPQTTEMRDDGTIVYTYLPELDECVK